VLKLM